MPTVSNPRDLLVQLLGELYYVERRSADEVLQTLAQAASDDDLREALQRHRDETKVHAERIEAAFRRLEVAPTSNRWAPFEALVDRHGELASSFADAALADVWHATAALHAEHGEIAAYTAILAFADAAGLGDAVEGLRDSLAEEEQARAALEDAIERVAGRR
jgi:ferritin-like metal-binding protein YciE